jgi:hypothetical protein
MAGVKKVELVEGNTLAVTDCGQSDPTLYAIDCGCDDGTPGVPPPVQDPLGTTPCRVADFTSKQILSWFETFKSALQSFGTQQYYNNLQTACNTVGLGVYVIEFDLWIRNLATFVGVNQVITQYYAWGAKQQTLECWLLGCLPNTGEIGEATVLCWRIKIGDGKTDLPPYAAILEALYGFTSVIPLSRYQELANIASTIPADCTCGSADQACTAGLHVDWRQVNDLQGWVSFSANSTQLPFDPAKWDMSPVWQIAPPTLETQGLKGPECGNQVGCAGTGIKYEFATPIKLCRAHLLAANWKTATNAIYPLNSTSAGIFYALADGQIKSLIQETWSAGFPGDRDITWWGEILNVKTLYMVVRSGGANRPMLIKSQYNDDSALAAAIYPTLSGAPYVAKSPVSVPANINQAGWDALFATESAGRIYDFPEGTYNNLLITPRAGDALRSKGGKGIVTLDGSQLLTNWQYIAANTYLCPYVRTIVKAGPIIGGYTLANDANYPRANWNIAVFRNGVPLRHVAVLSGAPWQTGCYHYDDVNGNLYVYDDPAGALLQVTHTRNAIKLQSSNIILENLEVKMYASVVQEGAITTPDVDAVDGLQLFNVSSNWNAGAGARVGAEKAIVQACDFSDNGQLGLSYGGSSTTPALNPRILSNTAHRNNWQYINPNFESGGVKGTYAEDVVNDGNETNDNIGKGNWTDLWVRRLLFIRNAARRNTGINHFIERTLDFQVQDCIAADGIPNGQSQPQNGQIVISNSQAVDYEVCYIRGCTAIHPLAQGTNAAGGIGVQQTAGDAVAPNYPGISDITRKIVVEDCDIYYRSPLYGRSGEFYSNAAANVGDRDTFYAVGNVVRRNNRHHGDAAGSHFQTNKSYPSGASNQTFAQYQATGMETGTTFDAASVPSELEG